MSFVRFVSAVPVEDMCTMKQFWSVFPDGILENFTGVRNFPRSTHMFICWRARKHGTGMKAQASCPNKEFEEGQ